MTERTLLDGKVAVLISPGYGAGWSSWGNDDLRYFMLFDPGLVGLALASADADDVEAYLSQKGIETPYLGGWGSIKVQWVPVGTTFRVHEYDGFETLIPTSEEETFTA